MNKLRSELNLIKTSVLYIQHSKTTKENTRLAVLGVLAHRMQNLKWPLGGPKMADGVWIGVYP